MHILVVDDDERLAVRLGEALEARGFTASVALDADAARAAVRRRPPDRIVLDLRLADDDGLRLLPDLLEAAPHVEVLLVTGYASIPVAVDAVKLGAVGVVQKPVDADGILAAFERSAAGPLATPATEYAAPSLARAEWEHIQRVLADVDGNITAAARRLGLHRRTLQRKLQKYPPRE